MALGPTLDTVHMLCAAFGEVAKIAMIEKASGLQALVQYPDDATAAMAKQTLDGYTMYPGGKNRVSSSSTRAVFLTTVLKSVRTQPSKSPCQQCAVPSSDTGKAASSFHQHAIVNNTHNAD